MDRRTVLAIIFIGKFSGFCRMPGLMNRVHEREFIRRMLAYSARKKRAKGPAAYSTLNPETSSDSPSVKSKGARLVSARVEIYHIIISGQDENRSQLCFCVMESTCSVNPPAIITTESRIIPRVTSYEMVCAIARRAPIKAYFELDAHPDHRIE